MSRQVEQGSKPASVEAGGVRSVLRYLARSKAAICLVLLLLTLVLVELTSKGFRQSFSEKYPFTVGVISSFLFIALGAVVVDLYLDERDEKRRLLEREREQEAWDPTARKVFEELKGALGNPSWLVLDAQMALPLVEAGKREANLDEIAKPIEEALLPIQTVLRERFSAIVLRPDLREAGRNAEEAVDAAEIAAGIVKRWDFKTPNYTGLRVMVEYLVEREQWFSDRRQAMLDEEAKRTEAEVNEVWEALGEDLG
jgi:hypothetical protein